MDEQNEVQAQDPNIGQMAPDPMAGQKPATARMPGLGVGRIVHYVLRDGSHRPAIVVMDWKQPNGSCNLQVFLDGTNDRLHAENCTEQEAERGIAWRTSVLYDDPGAYPEGVKLPGGTWHWPEKA